MKFQVGEKVRIGSREGTVVDVMSSRSRKYDLYEIQFDGESLPDETFYEEDSLKKIVEADTDISFKIDIAENVVVAIMMKGGKQIGRGHGHIIHEGAIGVAQAASYACKMLYSNMNGGSMIGGEYRG